MAIHLYFVQIKPKSRLHGKAFVAQRFLASLEVHEFVEQRDLGLEFGLIADIPGDLGGCVREWVSG